MIVFIDESGDAGFKIGKGSSRIFVMSLIIFDNGEDAQKTVLKIKNLKRTLSKSQKFEFKFNKSDKNLRLRFLNEIKVAKFRIRSVIFHKDKIHDHNLVSSSDNFYNYVLKCALDEDSVISNARIKIDGSGNKIFRNNLMKYLKSNLNSDSKKIIKSLNFLDSSKDELIQLADMVAGSTRRYFESNHNDNRIYRKILKDKECSIWENI